MPRRVLTAEEQAELRATVNVPALEKLLDRLEPVDRLGIITACKRDPWGVIPISQDIVDLMAKPPGIGPPSKYRVVDGQIRFNEPALQTLWVAVEDPRHGAA